AAAAGGVVAWQRRNETPPTPPEGVSRRLPPAEPFMDPVRESTPTPEGEPDMAIDEAVQVVREDRTDVPAAAIPPASPATPPATPLPDPPRKPSDGADAG